MFINKEDVKTIFRRLDNQAKEIEYLRHQVRVLKKQSNCNHGTFRGMVTHMIKGKAYFRICIDCEKVMDAVSESEYHQIEASYHTRQSDRAKVKEKHA